MKRIGVVLLALAPILALGAFAGYAQPLRAVAELRANGLSVGRVTFTQDLLDGGVWIQVLARGLTPGLHAVHIHAAGTCTAPGFLSAGGHFNPDGLKHGLAVSSGPHAGDLPNLSATAAGTTRHEVANYRITLGPGANSVFDADGSALVIHALPDDNVTDPAGNAGARVVCGVIEPGR